MPHHNARRNGHIHAVLGSELWNLQTTVAAVHNLLLHALHFVAQHNGILLVPFRFKMLYHGAALTLFHRQKRVTLLAERFQCVLGAVKMFPHYAVLGTQCRLVNLGMGRTSRYATKIDTRKTESVCCAEHRTHVVQTANMVQHHHQGKFARRLEFLHTDALHLRNFEFSHYIFSYDEKQLITMLKSCIQR